MSWNQLVLSCQLVMCVIYHYFQVCELQEEKQSSLQGQVVDRFCARSEATAYLTQKQKEGAGNLTPSDTQGHCVMEPACAVLQVARGWCGEATQVSPHIPQLSGGTVKRVTGGTPLTSELNALCLTMKVYNSTIV